MCEKSPWKKSPQEVKVIDVYEAQINGWDKKKQDVTKPGDHENDLKNI